MEEPCVLVSLTFIKVLASVSPHHLFLQSLSTAHALGTGV